MKLFLIFFHIHSGQVRLVRSGGLGAFEVDMPGFGGLADSSDDDNGDSENNSPPLSPRGIKFIMHKIFNI